MTEDHLEGFETPVFIQHDTLHLLARDARTIVAHWEVTDRKKWLAAQHFRCDWVHLPKVLRLYDVTLVMFNGHNANRTIEIELTPEADNWYISGLQPNTDYVADWGVRTVDRQFIPFMRSNAVRTTRDATIDNVDVKATAELAAPFASERMKKVENDRWEHVLAETAGRRNTFMLAWEYPPKCVGGLSRAVADLAEALAAGGEVVHVVTVACEGAPSFESMNGVYVHRVPVLCSGDTAFYHWQFEMNMAMVDHLVDWKENGGRIDLLHAHDWMVYSAAREIKHSYGLPLVATIHATEWGRQQGRLNGELQHAIHRLEWELTYEAGRVFVCSGYMKDEVIRLFQLPENKIDIVPNGIRLSEASEAEVGELAELRSHWFQPEDRIILFVGRLVYEKGVQVLLEAMPYILAQVPGAKLVAAGAGPMRETLERRASELGLGDRVSFWGFVDDAVKKSLYALADVCVFPSLYEPFGIVALEAMAARKPLVVSDAGGLAEIISHGVDGFKALPGHVESLAWHVAELLQNGAGERMAARAYEKLRSEYDPDSIALNVRDIYTRMICRTEAVQEAAQEQWLLAAER